MIVALYIPEELADAYHKERFQPTLARLKRYARQAGTPTDLKIIHQLEASFCVSREIVKGNGGVPLVGPGFGEAYCQLKAKLENVQASAYADSVDAGMRERRLKRAMWLARAERAKAIKWHEGLERYLQERKKWWPSRFCFMADYEMYHVWYKCWCDVERKCRAKAEEYK